MEPKPAPRWMGRYIRRDIDGAMAKNLVTGIISILVVILVFSAILVPTITSSVNNATDTTGKNGKNALTGGSAALYLLVPLLLVVAVVLAIVGWAVATGRVGG